MRAIGTHLEGKIQMSVEGREEMEVARRKLVREEAAAWRRRQKMPILLILSADSALQNVVAAPSPKGHIQLSP